MVPDHSSVWANGKYIEGTKRLEKQIPEIIVGPKSMSDEIWIDGIERLHSYNNNNTDNMHEIKKDSLIQKRNHSLQPHQILEDNNNVKPLSSKCFVTEKVNGTQEYLIGNFWHYVFIVWVIINAN